MPIYEFACPKCRKVLSFLSKRVNPDHLPICPKCGNKKLIKQVSGFAMLRQSSAGSDGSGEDGAPMPDLDDAKIARTMAEIERDMDHLDENNPRHMGQLMKKMKDALPPGSMPKEVDLAIKRLEGGEDPEKIEQDMGDVLGQLMGRGDDGNGDGGGYSKDGGLYDY